MTKWKYFLTNWCLTKDLKNKERCLTQQLELQLRCNRTKDIEILFQHFNPLHSAGAFNIPRKNFFEKKQQQQVKDGFFFFLTTVKLTLKQLR